MISQSLVKELQRLLGQEQVFLEETDRATILYSKRIKAALDPKNILNPGKIIGE